MAFDIDFYVNKLNLSVKARNQKFIQIKCPICNEGNSPYKARGYILLNGDSPVYNCMNECGSFSFYNFIKEQNVPLAKEFLKDIKLRNRKTYQEGKQDLEKRDELFGKTSIEDVLDNITKEDNPLDLTVVEFNKAYYTYTKDNEQITSTYEMEDLDDLAKDYLFGRGFKEEDIKDFKYVPHFGDIVIPMWFNKSKNQVYGMQMRRILEKRFHNQFFNNPKVTNLMNILRLPKGTKVYLFEAEFDRISTTLENSMAVLGAKLSQDLYDILKDYQLIQCGDADREGYNKTLEMSKEGYHCLVHQKEMENFKDFNKLLELGQSKEDITKYILDNIKSPRRAYIEVRRLM